MRFTLAHLYPLLLIVLPPTKPKPRRTSPYPAPEEEDEDRTGDSGMGTGSGSTEYGNVQTWRQAMTNPPPGNVECCAYFIICLPL